VENKDLVCAESNEIVIAGESPLAIMQLAMNKNLDLDKVEKMLAIQAKWEAMEAKKAYTKAMAAFKSDPPKISKDKHVRYQTQKGVTEYNHATLGNVTEEINRVLAQHGLSAGWTQAQADGKITVTCTITHELGHSESTSLTAEPDNSGNKNSIQAIGSTVTYLERYTLLAIAGLATHDQDDDGAGAGPQVKCINGKQQNTIRDILIADEVDEIEFLTWAKAESIDTIPEKNYNAIIKGLEDRKKVLEKKAGKK